jgi:hypothetical protein
MKSRTKYFVCYLCAFSCSALSQPVALPAPMMTDHFIIKYENGVAQGDVQTVADILEMSYATLTSRRQMPLRQNRIDVSIHASTPHYVQSAKVKWFMGGIYRDNTIHLQPPAVLQKRGILETTLTHELVHALLDDASHHGLPLWLNESAAVYFSGEMNRLKIPASLGVSRFHDLEKRIRTARSKSELDKTYYLLGLTMKFFIEEYGESKVQAVLSSFQQPQVIENVFNYTLGEDYQTVERKWLQHVRMKIRKK